MILKALRALARVVFPRASSATWRFWHDETVDYSREVGTGLDSNVITSPLLWIARTFPEARLAVRTRDADGEQSIDEAHPLARLVARPNPFYSGDALWAATLLSFLTSGDAYWAKVRGAAGAPMELWYLPHWLVSPQGDQGTFVTHYDYSPGGPPVRLEPGQVVHFRYGLDPRDLRRGFAPLRPLLREVYSDDEASRLVAALLRNRGVPGLLISPDKDVALNPGDAEATKAYLAEKFTGKNRGKPMVLTAATRVETLGFSPEELDLSALRNVPEERVCAALGLPAAVVGFGTGLEQTKVGATMQEMVKLAWTGCLIPTQRMLAAELTRSLLPDLGGGDGAEAFFGVSEVEALQQELGQVAQAVQVAVTSGVMMRSEARRRLGLETGPEDDVFLVPVNLIEVRRGEEAQPPPPPAPGGGAKAARRLTRLQARILRARDVAFRRFERAFRGRVEAFLDRLGAAAEAAYADLAKADEDELRVEQLFARMDVPRRRQELRSIFGAHYVAVHNDQVSALAGLGVGVNLPDSAQLEILTLGGTRAGLVDLSDAARGRALEVLRGAREEGLGVPETARRLRDAVPAGPWASPRQRAQVIARTETRYAQTQSALRTYRAAEGVDSVMILDARLGPTDQECEDVDGTVATFAEADRLLRDEHPNGTRDLVPVFAQEA